MNLTWSDAELRFRDEVRTFLADHLTPELRWAAHSLTSAYADPDVAMEWQRILHARGWVAPAWPIEFGGCGWSVTERYIWESELAAADAPPLSPMGISMCGPALIGYGTAAQKTYFLPRILSAEHFWCQGYSEAGSGSDLASLQMKAREEGDYLICSGHKLWTTHAHRANWIFCLVRTSSERIPQLGITFLLIDMTSPGISLKPTLSLSGEHIQNEVFFDEVRVPKSNVVGKIGDGWTVAKYLLTFERGGSIHGPGLKAKLSTLRRIAAEEPADDGRRLLDDARFRTRFTQLAVEVDAFEATELRIISALSAGTSPGAESSMMKTTYTELEQRVTELALDAVGIYGAPYQPHMSCAGGPTPGFEPPATGDAVGPAHSWNVAFTYFSYRAASIYAGTNEVQRNILAKSLLRL